MMQLADLAAVNWLKLGDLADTFPSIAKRGIKWCDARPETFDEIAQNPANGSGVRHAARFLLFVWTAGSYEWNLADSWRCWDTKHRAAWKAWAADPWFG